MLNIQNTFPLGFPWKTQDPFLFCVFHFDQYPAGNEVLGPATSLKGRMIGQDFDPHNKWKMYHGQKVPGFPQHPHRGFETITIVEKGLVDHSDSMGATGRFGHGDVQWMTAGRGVLHSEMFPLVHKDQENPLLLFQIWLNLPKRSKFVAPHYLMLWHEEIPIWKSDEAEVKIISGAFHDKEPLKPTPDSWAATPENDVAVWLIKIHPFGSLTLPSASHETNRSIYFYEGAELSIGHEKLTVGVGADLNSNGEIQLQNGNSASKILLLQGKPIGEPVVQQGPFVMNTREEISETIREYQRTQFGGWPWPQDEYVHPAEKGRFALHADGREEIR